MNKVLIYGVLGYLMAFAATWILGAYIAQEWDPREWEAISRALHIWLSFLVAVVVWVIMGGPND